jgi:hypothetical protein
LKNNFEKYERTTHSVIAKKPNDKSPEITNTLPGFLVNHQLPVKFGSSGFRCVSFRSVPVALLIFGVTSAVRPE